MKALSIPKKVNATVVRLVGGQVFLLTLLFIATRQPVIPAFLIIDFLVRSLGHPRFSLLAHAGILISRKLELKNKPIFFAPKRFAATIGLVLSLTALTLILGKQPIAAVSLIGVLGLFSFLEAFFGFCAGCRIYGFLIQKGLISQKYCADCVW